MRIRQPLPNGQTRFLWIACLMRLEAWCVSSLWLRNEMLNCRVIRMLADRGIRVAAGHCDPSGDQLRAAIDAGLSMFTHLGNGCPLMMHRHDNIIQRVLSLSDRLWIGFISDGVHVPLPALRNYFDWLASSVLLLLPTPSMQPEMVQAPITLEVRLLWWMSTWQPGTNIVFTCRFGIQNVRSRRQPSKWHWTFRFRRRTAYFHESTANHRWKLISS